MAQFVRHHARDLAVGSGGFEHPSMQVHRTARERERVDLFQVHDVKRVPKGRLPEFMRNLGEESLTDSIDEVIGRAVVQHRQLAPDFSRRLPAEPHILFGREAVAVRLNARLRGRREADREGGYRRDQ